MAKRDRIAGHAVAWIAQRMLAPKIEIGYLKRLQATTSFAGTMVMRTEPEQTLDELITSDPEVMGGRRVFRGTRVPVEILFENLADGMSVHEILDEYDTLDRDDVVRVLELASALIQPRAA